MEMSDAEPKNVIIIGTEPESQMIEKLFFIQ